MKGKTNFNRGRIHSMIRSLITLFIVIVAGFMLIFISKGSADISFQRVAMDGDTSNSIVLDSIRRKNTQAVSMDEYEGQDISSRGDRSSYSGAGPTVVLWISIPGFRGDYVDNARTPFFDRMIDEGTATPDLTPNFPCLTFPAHISLATGKTPDKHGIPLDVFRADGEIVDHPMNGSLLTAEPIWTTATRQGIRTLVHDWPMSQNQTGEHAAAIFKTDFDPETTDQQRLDALWEAWSKDSGVESGGDEAKASENADSPAAEDAEPAENADAAEDKVAEEKDAAGEKAVAGGGSNLRLLMIRLDDVHKGGLKFGPREDETYDVVGATDSLLGGFFTKVEANWKKIAPGGASLVIMVTTDHGLTGLDKNINLPELLGPSLMKNLDVVAHDAVGHLFFKDLPENEGEKNLVIKNLDDELKKRIYFRTYAREDLPAEWAYNIPGRVGDRVVVLKNGYGFTDVKASEPVFDPAEGPGFPVESSVRMKGQAIIWGWPNAPETGELGEIDFLGFHTTACELLGIKPAEGTAEYGLLK